MFNLFKKSKIAKAKIEFDNGVEYFKNGDYNNAITSFTHSIKLGFKNAMLYNARGNAYRKLENYEKAIIDLEQAKKLVNSNDQDFFYEIYCGLGCTLNSMNNFVEAISYFDQAIKLKPNEMMAYVNRGIAYEMKEDYQSSVGDFSKVIELFPTWFGAYLNRGNIYNKIGEYQKAIRDYEKCIELVPSGYNVEPLKLELDKLRR